MKVIKLKESEIYRKNCLDTYFLGNTLNLKVKVKVAIYLGIEIFTSFIHLSSDQPKRKEGKEMKKSKNSLGCGAFKLVLIVQGSGNHTSLKHPPRAKRIPPLLR